MGVVDSMEVECHYIQIETNEVERTKENEKYFLAV